MAYETEIQIVNYVKGIMQPIHESIMKEDSTSRIDTIKKFIPKIVILTKQIFEHHEKMGHSIIKDDFHLLDNHFQKYLKECQKVNQKKSIDISKLNSEYTIIIDGCNVVKEHANIATKK